MLVHVFFRGVVEDILLETWERATGFFFLSLFYREIARGIFEILIMLAAHTISYLSREREWIGMSAEGIDDLGYYSLTLSFSKTVFFIIGFPVQE